MWQHPEHFRSPHPRRIILIIATKDKCTQRKFLYDGYRRDLEQCILALFLRGALKHNAGRMSECPQHPRSICHNRRCKGDCVLWILSADLGANNGTKLGTSISLDMSVRSGNRNRGPHLAVTPTDAHFFSPLRSQLTAALVTFPDAHVMGLLKL